MGRDYSGVIRLTVSTLGARRFSSRERDSMYLCREAYSRAEMVYRNALRRMASFAVVGAFGAFGAAADEELDGDAIARSSHPQGCRRS